MLDNRIYTFLKLCEVLNYRVAAEQLNITQPAVTQHIQYLEREYKCRLFIYTGHKLIKTPCAAILEEAARSTVYNDELLRLRLSAPERKRVRMGATKSIGSYVIKNEVKRIINRDDVSFSLCVDNTEHLLEMLNKSQLDFALIEGFFDKTKYSFKLFRNEPFVGICAKGHPFCSKTVPFNEVLNQELIVREKGSGTRAIFELLLTQKNISLQNFKRVTEISSFELIKNLVADSNTISFVYQSVADSQKDIGTFKIENVDVSGEFNFVYLKDTSAGDLIDLFYC